MTEPVVLEIFSDYIWPWCYFITGRIEKLEQAFDIDIRWRAFPLHPEIPAGGVLLKSYFAGKIDNIEKMMGSIKATASDLGLPFGEITHIYNTRLAQELSCLAETEHKGAEFHKAAFAAYFVEGKNLADLKVLETIAASAGLEKTAAREVVEQRIYKQQVDADWQRAAESRITAVPTFMVQQERMVGAQPYEKLKSMMSRHNVRPKHS